MPSSKMTPALAAINAEDFIIGTPAGPTALGMDYLIFQIDPDLGLLAKSRDYNGVERHTPKLGNQTGPLWVKFPTRNEELHRLRIIPCA